MNTSPLHALDRHQVIQALARIWDEWEKAGDGQPLNTVKGNVGLLLEDVMEALKLNDLEKLEVRGLVWRMTDVS